MNTNLRILNEKSSYDLTFRFRDKNRELIVPDSATWRVDCETSGNVIRADTNIIPIDSEVTVELTADDTKIVSGAAKEKRLVTVKALIKGRPFNEEYRYQVKNLSQVS